MKFQVGDRVRVLRFGELREHPSYVPDRDPEDGNPGYRWYYGIPEWDLDEYAEKGETVVTKVVEEPFPYSGRFKSRPVCACRTELTGDLLLLENMLEPAEPLVPLVPDDKENLFAALLG